MNHHVRRTDSSPWRLWVQFLTNTLWLYFSYLSLVKISVRDVVSTLKSTAFHSYFLFALGCLLTQNDRKYDVIFSVCTHVAHAVLHCNESNKLTLFCKS